MIKLHRKDHKHTTVQSNYMHYNTITQVKYECSYVYIVMTSRKKFLNGIKGIFNKAVS